jgi:hypothetical protein
VLPRPIVFCFGLDRNNRIVAAITRVTTITIVDRVIAIAARDRIISSLWRATALALRNQLSCAVKKAIASAENVTMYDIAANAGFVVSAASVEVLVEGTATGTCDIGIAGTDITGLTAFDTATVGGVIKLATAANSVIATSSASSLTLQQNTAGLGGGKLRVRVFGTFLDS